MGLRLSGLTALMGAAVFVAGCGGQTGNPVPQVSTAQSRAHRAASGDLIYVTNGCSGVCVLAYPSGDLVSSIGLGGDKEGACSDSAGNVFITNGTQVVEFAHAGTTPIATLSIPGRLALGCSIDPTTGNLAVTFNGNGVNLAIFPSATGEPTFYDAPTAAYCGYDADGNLFLSGEKVVAELANGSSSFQLFSIVGKARVIGQIQWDGRSMTLESRSPGSIKLLRLRFSGSAATVVGTSRLKGIKGNAGQSWLFDDKVLVPYGNHGQFETQLGVWNYPKAGKVETRYRHFGTGSFHGLTISVAPSH